MAVESETNGGMFVVMRHDIVDNLSPTGTAVMQGGPPGIPFPVSNSSVVRMQQPIRMTASPVKDPVPIPRQHQTAISHPHSDVSIPGTASPGAISPHLNPFVNSQQVASTAQAVKKYFAGGRTRQRWGQRPTAQGTANTPLDSRPQTPPDKPVEPVMVVDLTQQDGRQHGPRSERSVGHSRVPNAQSETSSKSLASRVMPDIQAPSASGNSCSELVEDPLVGLSSEKPVQSGAVVEDGASSRPVDQDAMEVGESTSGRQRECENTGELAVSTERGWTHYKQVALSATSSLEVVPDSEQADSTDGVKLVSGFKGDGSADVAATANGGRNTAEGEELATPLSLPLPKLPALPPAPPHHGTQEVPNSSDTSNDKSDGSKQLCEDLPQDTTVKAAPPSTPTQGGAGPSPKATPLGILKHTSQFDTPSSASKVRLKLNTYIMDPLPL